MPMGETDLDLEGTKAWLGEESGCGMPVTRAGACRHIMWEGLPTKSAGGGPGFLYCKWHLGWHELPETVGMRMKLLALCLASPRQGEDS